MHDLASKTTFQTNGADSSQHRLYRSLVNKVMKIYKAKFYKFKVEKMKDENSKV